MGGMNNGDSPDGVAFIKRKYKATGSPPVVMRRVKRIGRHTKHLYCERCGQKRRVCRCET